MPFEGAGFVNNAFKQAPDRGVTERPGIRLHNVVQNFRLALRLPRRDFQRLLDVSDFHRASRPLIQQLDQLLVNRVDALAPLGNIAHADYSSAPVFNCRTNFSMAFAPPALNRSSIACTTALPTTAASA